MKLLSRHPSGAVPTTAVRAALAGARRSVLWLDDPAAPAASEPLRGAHQADLVVVGAGFGGLWTALLAKERDPGRSVIVLEGRRVGWAASGRNGGFVSASLTHGQANGMARFGDEYDLLARLGQENLTELESSLSRYGVDAEWERSGELTVAVSPWQADELRASIADTPIGEEPPSWLDAAQTRARVDSPTYLGALYSRAETGLVNPAKLAWGLAEACRELGVTVVEQSPVTGIARSGAGLAVHTEQGSVQARQVVLATNAFRSPLRRVRPYIVPVYDHVIATEPLTTAQLSAIGWAGREGISDAGNLFHYYRLSADNRIVFGGYLPSYHTFKSIRPVYDQNPATHELLTRHLLETFPQLDGIRIAHTWGGVIDTCSRFCPFFGTAYGGRLAYSAGYTGLGVGATRFGARVTLDLLDGADTEATTNSLVRSKPVPWPPEPFTKLGVACTVTALRFADANEGKRGLWLRTLDRFGLGFDF